LIRTENDQIAKIYHPLYYAFYHADAPELKIDVTAQADCDYAIESAAYTELEHSTVLGGIAPDYFGSWTMDLTTHIGDELVTRVVRMILMEYVTGVRMLDLDPENLAREERENIMRRLIEGDYDLKYAGVRHDDVSPRNVIISATTALSNPDLRLTLVDYGCSIVYHIRYGAPALPQYNNPLFHWTSASLWSSWGWLPLEDEERVAWMWNIWGEGREGKYVKVERDPENALGGPKEPKIKEINKSEEGK
jgi:serine/threonine protein kinase